MKSNKGLRYVYDGHDRLLSIFRYVRETMFRQENGDRRNVPNIAVVLTDGRSNNPDETWQQALELRKSGSKIFVVGIGQGVSQVWTFEWLT